MNFSVPKFSHVVGVLLLNGVVGRIKCVETGFAVLPGTKLRLATHIPGLLHLGDLQRKREITSPG